MAIIINPFMLPRLADDDDPSAPEQSITVPASFYLDGTAVNAPTVTNYPDVLTSVKTTKVYRSFTLASDGPITVQCSSPLAVVRGDGLRGETYVAAAQVQVYNATSHKVQLWLYRSDENGNLTQVDTDTSGTGGGVASAQSKIVTGSFDQYLP